MLCPVTEKNTKPLNFLNKRKSEVNNQCKRMEELGRRKRKEKTEKKAKSSLTTFFYPYHNREKADDSQ